MTNLTCAVFKEKKKKKKKKNMFYPTYIRVDPEETAH